MGSHIKIALVLAWLHSFCLKFFYFPKGWEEGKRTSQRPENRAEKPIYNYWRMGGKRVFNPGGSICSFGACHATHNSKPISHCLICNTVCWWLLKNLSSSIAVQLPKFSQIAQSLMIVTFSCQRSGGHSNLHRLPIMRFDRWRWRSNRKWTVI